MVKNASADLIIEIITVCWWCWPCFWTLRILSPIAFWVAWSGRCPGWGPPRSPGPGNFPSASWLQQAPGSWGLRGREWSSWCDWLQHWRHWSSAWPCSLSGRTSCWWGPSWRWSLLCFDINGGGVLTRRPGYLRLSHQEVRLYTSGSRGQTFMRRKAPAVLRSASQPRSQIMEKTEGMDFSVQVRVKSHLHCVRRQASISPPCPRYVQIPDRSDLFT